MNVTSNSCTQCIAFLVSILACSAFQIVSTQRAVAQNPAAIQESACPTVDATFWEYKVASIAYNSSGLQSDLNQLGANGWELVQIQEGFPAIFRRPRLDAVHGGAEQVQLEQLGDLQQKRVALLTDRVAEMKKLFDSAHVDIQTYTRSEIDLIRVRLEYGKTDGEKLQHLRELAKKFDLLIELAEFLKKEPPGRRSPTSEPDLLWIRSERVNIEIQISLLEQ